MQAENSFVVWVRHNHQAARRTGSDDGHLHGRLVQRSRAPCQIPNAVLDAKGSGAVPHVRGCMIDGHVDAVAVDHDGEMLKRRRCVLRQEAEYGEEEGCVE